MEGGGRGRGHIYFSQRQKRVPVEGNLEATQPYQDFTTADVDRIDHSTF